MRFRFSSGMGENKAVDFAVHEGLHGCTPNGRNDLMSQSTSSTPITGTSIDELTQAQPAFEQFLDKHNKKLIVLGLLLIILGLGYMLNQNIKQDKEEAAGAILASNSDAYELKKIAEDFPGTAAAASSKILLAEQEWQDGKQDDAITSLREIIDAAEPHPARPTAIASLASKLLSQGKTDEAESLFKELTVDQDAAYLAAYAWIALGDIAVKKGNLEAAESAYTKVEKNFANSSLAGDATTRRLLSKAASPVEVDAPVDLLDPKIINPEENTDSGSKIDSLSDALKAASEGSIPFPTPEENTKDN